MEIESFEIKNFKSIEDSGKINVSKINLIIGPNSSGKSSLLQALLLMKQTFEADVPNTALVLNGPYGNFGEYADFIHKKNTSNSFEIIFNFKKTEKLKPYVCDICGAEYANKKWYIKHVSGTHKKYWNKFENILLDDSYHSSKSNSLKLKYAYDESLETITLSEVELTNPPISDGLILSSLKIVKSKNKLTLYFVSIDGQILFAKDFTDENDVLTHSSILVEVNKQLYGLPYIYNHYTQLRYTNPTYFHNIGIVGNSESKTNEAISLLTSEFIDSFSSKMAQLRAEYRDKTSQKQIDEIIFREELIASQLNILSQKANPFSSLSIPDEIKIGLSIEARTNYLIIFINSRLNYISEFLKGIHHVGALRGWPERIYFGTGGKPNHVGVRGEFTQEIFWFDKKIGHSNLISNVNSWLKDLKFNVELDVERVIGDTYQLKIKQNGLSVNISDVGFGISQFLPILTECLKYSEQENIEKSNYGPYGYYSRPYFHESIKCIISEEPEIHLNPRVQAEMADLFIKISDSNVIFFIETHSEHIITRIQRRVAEKTFDLKNVNIYYISLKENKSNIERLNLLSDGTFEYWPEGFFQEDYEDSFEILKASIRHEEVD